MLGEKFAESKGQVIGQRVLTVDGSPKMETSFKEQGVILGVNAQNTGTYWAELRPSGSLYGEGQGIAMSETGETLTWKGSGVGVIQNDGSIKYRGAIYYQTTSSKWERLNTIAGVFEFDIDKDGKTLGTTHEWR